MCLVILVFISLSRLSVLSCYVVMSNQQEHTDVMFIKVDQEKDVLFAIPAANIPIYIWYCTKTFENEYISKIISVIYTWSSTSG